MAKRYTLAKLRSLLSPEATAKAERQHRDLEADLSRNERLAELLTEHGDPLNQARPVQHWAYFPTEESRAQFIACIGQRFSNIDAHVSPVSRGKEYAVTFWHAGTPDADSMTEITSALSLAAESCGGAYDGWETQILS